MIILTTNDFQGFHQISKNSYDVEDLESYINDNEKNFLCRLLGEELAELFIADLDGFGVPATQIYKDIYDPFCKTVEDSILCGETITQESFGIRSMLAGLVYKTYVADQPLQNTMTGTVSSSNSNSEGVKKADLMLSIDKRWNRAAFTSEAIIWYIKENIDVYPTFKGDVFEISYLDFI